MEYVRTGGKTMKPHVKEILKNKADKMVDLIIDDIGTNGEKYMSASLLDDRNKDVKYLIQVAIKSGDPDTLGDFMDTESIPTKVEELETRVAALELKEDADTIYDDSDIKARLLVLENKQDNDTIYDDSGIKARLTILEEKEDADTIYDDSEIIARIEALEAKVNETEGNS